MADIDSIKKDGFAQLAKHVEKDLEVEDLFIDLVPDLLVEGKYTLANGGEVTEAAAARYAKAKDQIVERIEKLSK